MIEKVISALMERDAVTLASYFSENCKYFDYCPSLNGESNTFIYGSAGLEMLFKSKFAFGAFEIAEPLIENENTASFFCSYSGPYIFARLNIEEYDNAGLVKKIVVHPA